MSKIGIDISSHQREVDADKVLNNISFIILRNGYGVSYLLDKQKDTYFESNYNKFHNKVPVGVYYYQYANEIGEGTKEAENCIKYLDGKALELPIYYDVEDSSIAGLSKDTLTNIIIEFCEKIKESGYKPGVYANKYFFTNKINLDELQNRGYSIWCASYGTNNGTEQENAKLNKNEDIWQYSSRGQVSGISGYADMDVLLKDIESAPNTTITTSTNESKEVVKSSGDAVIRSIQETLNNRYGTGLNVDGYYGPLTKTALVKGLQNELNSQFIAGLVVDGIFGPATKSKCPNVRQGAKGNITYLIQAMLYCKGYDTNGVEGIFGKGTTKAVRRFQANQGIATDGIVGPDTFERLFK